MQAQKHTYAIHKMGQCHKKGTCSIGLAIASIALTYSPDHSRIQLLVILLSLPRAPYLVHSSALICAALLSHWPKVDILEEYVEKQRKRSLQLSRDSGRLLHSSPIKKCDLSSAFWDSISRDPAVNRLARFVSSRWAPVHGHSRIEARAVLESLSAWLKRRRPPVALYFRILILWGL